MKVFETLSLRNLLVLGGLTLALAPQAARAQPKCSNSIMNGTYVASGSGTGVGGVPVASVALLVYNGDGTGMSLSGTKSTNGVISTSSNVAATFTVNPDCTGFKTIGSTNYNFVITPDGSTITWIVTTSGVTLMGTGVRMPLWFR